MEVLYHKRHKTNKNAKWMKLSVAGFICLVLYLLYSRHRANQQLESQFLTMQQELSSMRSHLRAELNNAIFLQNEIKQSQKLIEQKYTQFLEQEKLIKHSSYQIRELIQQFPQASNLISPPNEDALPRPHSVTVDRRNSVRNAFAHAWSSYKLFAWGKDELAPLSRSSTNWLNMGLTIVDSLDTLWIMEFYSEFKEARDWVEKNLEFSTVNKDVSVFETTIRELGGLLSAYELTRDRMFLKKAEDLGERLLASFDHSNPADFLPHTSINLATLARKTPPWLGKKAVLSEVGSLQLEFLYLAHHTQRPDYAIKVMEIFKVLDNIPKRFSGLYPVYVNHDGTFASDSISLGALGDSFYEYMLKLWLFTSQQAPGYRRMYQESMDGIHAHMVQSSSNGWRYLSQLIGANPVHRMEHLACFAGGMFALGVATNSSATPEKDLQLAKDIAATCHESYVRTRSKIGPEVFEFDPQSGAEFQVHRAAYYILRPEVVETYFIMWRVTKDPIYREWAWQAFQAIEASCKSSSGYSGLRNVTADVLEKDDTQQSFFLAETLKYLYLTFCEDDVIPLDKYVFNTEAHPLSIIRDPLSKWPADLRASLLLS